MILFIIVILLIAYIGVNICSNKVHKERKIARTNNENIGLQNVINMFRSVVKIILFILLLILMILLWMMNPMQWADPLQFNEDVVDVIRVCALFELVISIILVHQNWKKPITKFLLLLTNIYTIYKVMSTYIIF